MTGLEGSARTVDPQSAIVDQTVVEEFAGRMVEVLDDACVALMTSIGHQTGLFDVLARLGRPSTSAEVATEAGLHERYVREWLAAMATARIVVLDPSDGTYQLPAEHAAVLTEAAGPDNMARLMQYVPLLASVEQPVVDCFRRGGGVSYSHYPRFHRLMAEDSAAVVDHALLDSVLPLVPGLIGALNEGIDVADVGCGSGHAVNVMARAFPASRFRGYDFSDEAIAAARAETAALGVTNAHFEVRDVTEFEESAVFDLVTAFDAIHDQAHPARVLGNIHTALRPEGTFLMVDFKASSDVADNIGVPAATFLYTVSTMHCMTVSLGLGGDGLGTAWGRQLAEAMLIEAGFAAVHVQELEADPFNYYYVSRKAPPA